MEVTAKLVLKRGGAVRKGRVSKEENENLMIKVSENDMNAVVQVVQASSSNEIEHAEIRMEECCNGQEEDLEPNLYPKLDDELEELSKINPFASSNSLFGNVGCQEVCGKQQDINSSAEGESVSQNDIAPEQNKSRERDAHPAREDVKDCNRGESQLDHLGDQNPFDDLSADHQISNDGSNGNQESSSRFGSESDGDACEARLENDDDAGSLTRESIYGKESALSLSSFTSHSNSSIGVNKVKWAYVGEDEGGSGSSGEGGFSSDEKVVVRGEDAVETGPCRADASNGVGAHVDLKSGDYIISLSENINENNTIACGLERKRVLKKRPVKLVVEIGTNVEELGDDSVDPHSTRQLFKTVRSEATMVTSHINIFKQKSRSTDDLPGYVSGLADPSIGTIENRIVYTNLQDEDRSKPKQSRSQGNLFDFFSRKTSGGIIFSKDSPLPQIASTESLTALTLCALGTENFQWLEPKPAFYVGSGDTRHDGEDEEDDSGDQEEEDNLCTNNLSDGKDTLYPILYVTENTAKKQHRAALKGKAPISSPLDALFTGLVRDVEIMKDAVVETQSQREQQQLGKVKVESLLTDVLFSVHHVMGSLPKSSWTLHSTRLTAPSSVQGDDLQQGYEVTFEEVLTALKEVFGLEEVVFNDCLLKARARMAPEIVLHLTIHSARELKMKSVSGSANPFITASVPGDSHRTRTLQGTRSPSWEQTFDMRVRCLQQDALKLEIWHEYDHLGVGAVRNVKDLRGLGRLVKGTTAADKHLLGSVTVPLKRIQENGLEGWYPLIKEDQQTNSLSTSTTNLAASHSPSQTNISSSQANTHFAASLSSQLAHLKSSGAALIHSSHGPGAKARGELHVSATVGPSAREASNARRPYDALLVKMLLHYVNNAGQVPSSHPWSGSLPPGALCALHLTGLVEGVTLGLKGLGLWTVASRAEGVDLVWLVDVLKVVLDMEESTLSEDDLQVLKDSLVAWIFNAEDRLTSLHESFPVNRGVTATHQLSGLLRSLRLLSQHPLSKKLLTEEKKNDLVEIVKRSVEKHASLWWLSLLERELKDSLTPEQQVERVINITNECHQFVANATSFYSPVFVNDFGFPYLRITYLFITKKLNPCVRPLLMNIYNRLLSNHAHNKDMVIKEADTKNQYALTAGTSLWQLYVNLGRIHRLGVNMPLEVQQESGVKEYHRWFSKGVMHWLQVAQVRTQKIISNAVTADQLVPCDEYCNFSSSATDAITVFIGVRNWWEELAWPDPENSGVLLGKILEDLCCSATFYCDLLRNKVDSMYNSQRSEGKVFITKQICIGLNNIERVHDEVAKLPEYFRISELLNKIRTAGGHATIQNGGTEQDGAGSAADQFRGTFERLISSAMDNMDTKVQEFVDTVVEKITGILHLGLSDACEASNPHLLLGEVLDPGLGLMRENLQEANFRRFLTRLWDVLLGLMRTLVIRNAERKRAPFFQGVYDILCSSLKFFTPDGGLDINDAMNDEYSSLMELLGNLRLSSEALVSCYYAERAEERQLMSVTSRGDLFVTVFFTHNSKLVVEVVMARDMQLDDVGSLSSRASHGAGILNLSSGGAGIFPVDSYVKVQLVPVEWFPSAQTCATKVMKRSDPATFQETFTFVMSPEDTNVQEGFLLFTLKDHNLARSNTFIGEAAVALSSVPLVESEAIQCQPKSLQLKMTKPGMEAGYKSLAILRMRTSSDRVACSFLKKVSSRFVDSRVRKESKEHHAHSTDDEKQEKGIPRSPNILDKLRGRGMNDLTLGGGE